MKKILFPVCFATTLALVACNPKNNATSGTGIKQADSSATAATTKKYTLAMVANKYDPSCGMPLTAGLEDTTHYDGKVYGFCSKECKNEFLKNPKGYVAKMK